MSEELTIPEDPYKDRTPEEWREAAEKWFAVATDLKSVQDELTEDLAEILMMARNYQKGYVMMDMPDPNLVKLRSYLIKYKMPSPHEGDSSFRVYVDGVDITTDPESIPGEVEYMELVADEDGKMKFLPSRTKTREVPELETFADEDDPTEPVDSSLLKWLEDEIVLYDGKEWKPLTGGVIYPGPT